MSSPSQHTIKVIAGTLLVVSLPVGFLERWYAPHALLMESSPDFPGWVGWLGFLLVTVGTVAYLGVDIAESRKLRREAGHTKEQISASASEPQSPAAP